MFNWLALGLICMIALGGTSCSAPNSVVTANSKYEPPYIYSFPDKYNAGFLSVEISGDGNVVTGTTDQKNYWVWSKVTGTSSLVSVPAGYEVTCTSMSYDGRVMAGILSVPWPNNQGTASKLFRWTAASGITVLPDLPASDVVLFVLMSDDGKSISFLCKTADGKPCKGPPFPPGGERQELKVWTAVYGYQSVGPDFGNKYSYIEQSPDLKRFLVDSSYTYWKYVNGQRAGLYVHQVPSALMDASGTITSFQAPYRDFKLQTVYNNIDLSLLLYKPYLNNSIMNTLVYNSSGALVTKNLPKGCINFDVTVIDGENNIFGECFGPTSRPIGLRISGSLTETVSQWLKDGGLKFDFPLNTEIFRVSDNGKTVQGFVDPGVGTCGCSIRSLSKPPATTGPPGSQYGFDPASSFIAHVN